MSLAEIAAHPHNASRAMFAECSGVLQPAPAPRFTATPGSVLGPPPTSGEHTGQVLRERGLTPAQIETLLSAGVVSQA